MEGEEGRREEDRKGHRTTQVEPSRPGQKRGEGPSGEGRRSSPKRLVSISIREAVPLLGFMARSAAERGLDRGERGEERNGERYNG
eukprot:2459480-Pyramimonas_sp.AAC.1